MKLHSAIISGRVLHVDILMINGYMKWWRTGFLRSVYFFFIIIMLECIDKAYSVINNNYLHLLEGYVIITIKNGMLIDGIRASRIRGC